MEANFDSDPVEQDLGLCVCQGRPSLDVLKDVQKAYEERIELINKSGGKNKTQKELELLRSWVGDLVEQNGLLARAVEEIEAEVSSRMVFERRRNIEIESELRAEVLALRGCLARKDSDVRGLLELLRRLRDGDRRDTNGIRFYEVTEHDIFGINGKPDIKCEKKHDDTQSDKQIHKRRSKKGFEQLTWDEKKNISDKVNGLKMLNDSLKKENFAKDREIRKLSSDVQHREQTIASMRHDTSYNRSIPTKDEAVMTEASSSMDECSEVVLNRENPETNGHHNEVKLKPSEENVRAMRKENVDLREEVRAMSQLCAALYEQRRAASVRLQFKDDIIREMRRQLRMAKAKLEVTKSLGEPDEGEGTRRSRRPRRRDGPDWSSRGQEPSPDGSVSIQYD